MAEAQPLSFGCGLWPRAREGRAARLSLVEIVSAFCNLRTLALIQEKTLHSTCRLARSGLRRIFLHLLFRRQSRKIIPRFGA